MSDSRRHRCLETKKDGSLGVHRSSRGCFGMRYVYPTVPSAVYCTEVNGSLCFKKSTAPARLHAAHIQRTIRPLRTRWVRRRTIRGHRGRLPVGVFVTSESHEQQCLHGPAAFCVVQLTVWNSPLCQWELSLSLCPSLWDTDCTATFDRHLKSQ